MSTFAELLEARYVEYHEKPHIYTGHDAFEAGAKAALELAAEEARAELAALKAENERLLKIEKDFNEVNEDDERERCRLLNENARLSSALIRLRDCDFMITPADRMDAVRAIAREALFDE